MKNAFQLAAIAITFLVFMAPRLSHGQVTISMEEGGVRINSTANLRYVAYYTKEGFREGTDYSKYSEQPNNAGIPVSQLKGEHANITVFAINEDGDVASKVFPLTEGAAAIAKSTLTVTTREDGAIQIDAPSKLMFSAIYTKEGYWGLNEFSLDDASAGRVIGSLNSGKYSFISVAAIDADGNVYAEKIPLKKEKAQ